MSHLDVPTPSRPFKSVRSPLPTPDPSVFESRTYVEKRHIPSSVSKKKACPSPPTKSPPMSRLFHKRQAHESLIVHAVTPNPRNNYISPHATPADERRVPTSIFGSEFQVEGKLGEGSFAEVYKARWVGGDGNLYAIKRSRHAFRGSQDRRRAIQEVEAIAMLQSDHCVRYHRAWEEDSVLFIQMEYCSQGSLMDFISSHGILEEELVWHAAIDIALGLKHIHSAGFLHLDIKPENILLDSAGALKIGDFGIAVRVGSENHKHALEKLDLEGDPAYLPDELLRGNPSDFIGESADIFSLGATILEMAADIEMPRGGPTWHDLREGKLPMEALERHQRSSDLIQTIQWMMDPDPEARPSAQQLLNHPPIKRRSLHERERASGGGALRAKVQAFCAAGAHIVSNILTSPFRMVKDGTMTDESSEHTGDESAEDSSNAGSALGDDLCTNAFPGPAIHFDFDSDNDLDDDEFELTRLGSPIRDSPSIPDLSNISRHLGFDDSSDDEDAVPTAGNDVVSNDGEPRRVSFLLSRASPSPSARPRPQDVFTVSALTRDSPTFGSPALSSPRVAVPSPVRARPTWRDRRPAGLSPLGLIVDDSVQNLDPNDLITPRPMEWKPPSASAFAARAHLAAPTPQKMIGDHTSAAAAEHAEDADDGRDTITTTTTTTTLLTTTTSTLLHPLTLTSAASAVVCFIAERSLLASFPLSPLGRTLLLLVCCFALGYSLFPASSRASYVESTTSLTMGLTLSLLSMYSLLMAL